MYELVLSVISVLGICVWVILARKADKTRLEAEAGKARRSKNLDIAKEQAEEAVVTCRANELIFKPPAPSVISAQEQLWEILDELRKITELEREASAIVHDGKIERFD